ncbi:MULTISPECIES: helix-turn-helix transcriptional regulator [unclassified Micromonospora]|uniref:ArsR/SmtB family transcription factor n=1 Tax=unclassified Micromonospora TaxID=2617518 RepID=UPI000EF4CB64|nr:MULTISPECIES: metalloregulator ArsR/SmtB family transcription factor [unclassified Micromonospora]RLP86966.1 transcriptional regulator [Micromonospora sp. CV4]RLP88197.1 transcriptional regulator [Micromonospora sp. BL4]
MSESDVFAALANPTRRELLRLLRDGGQQPVQRLADHFDMRRPSLSEHLKVLKEAGLVTERPVGRQRLYALRPEPLREVADWLSPYEAYWRGRLGALRDVLDELDDE